MAEPGTGVLRDARELLGAVAGPVGHLEVIDRFRPNVWRAAVRGAASDLPPTVIVRAGPDRIEDPRADAGDGLRWHEVFANEVAGTRFLAELPELAGRVPVELAGDVDRQVLVSSDLGSGPSVADALLGDDRERALVMLERHAATLGDVAAATFGNTERYTSIRLDCGPPASPDNRRPAADAALRRFLGGLGRELGVTSEAGLDAEVASIVELTSDPPAGWVAYTPADACPDNNLVAPDGRLAVFDFGYGGVRHLGLDTAYFSLPYPTCWCYAPMSADLRSHLLGTYRAAVAVRVPAARDTATWDAVVAWAAAAWFVDWIIDVAVAEDNRDRRRGPLSGKAAVASQLATVAQVTATHYPAVSGVAQHAARSLRDRWGIDEPSTYPALR